VLFGKTNQADSKQQEEVPVSIERSNSCHLGGFHGEDDQRREDGEDVAEDQGGKELGVGSKGLFGLISATARPSASFPLFAGVASWGDIFATGLFNQGYLFRSTLGRVNLAIDGRSKISRILLGRNQERVGSWLRLV